MAPENAFNAILNISEPQSSTPFIKPLYIIIYTKYTVYIGLFHIDCEYWLYIYLFIIYTL